MATIKKTENNKWWRDMKYLEPLCTVSIIIKMVQLKILWRVLTKLNIELLYDLAILLLGIYPKELKAGS